MVKEEEEFQEKYRPFRTYTRKSRNFPCIQQGEIEKELDPAQQMEYAHIESLETQKRKKKSKKG